MRKAKFLRCVSATACLGLVAGLGVSAVHAQDAPNVHIGVLAPLSGPFELLGRQVERGVTLALEALGEDAAGIIVTAVDDGCDEDRGRDAANQLVGAQVDVVVGGVCWRPALSARDVLSIEDIPFVASGVRYQAFTDEAEGPVYRLSGRDDLQARVFVDALVDGALDGLIGGSASNRPLVLFYTDGNYGRTLAEAVQEGLEQEGLPLALYEPFEPDADLDRFALRAEAENAGLVMVFAGQADSALMADALARRLPNVPVVAGDSVMTTEFRLMAADGADGVVFARPTPWRDLADAQTVTTLEGDAPGSVAGLVLPSMAATQVALQLLDDGESPFETVFGLVRFDANGDADLPAFVLWQWREGLIWPFEPAVDEAG